MKMTYPLLSPAFAVHDAKEAIAFYERAFGAVEKYRLIDPETGRIGHAEMTIKGQLIMLADEYPAYNKSPKTLGGTSMKLCLNCENVEEDFNRAVQAGAAVVQPVHDQFYGHHTGSVRDPFGHEWAFFQEIEQVSPVEMQKRWNDMVTKKA